MFQSFDFYMLMPPKKNIPTISNVQPFKSTGHACIGTVTILLIYYICKYI